MPLFSFTSVGQDVLRGFKTKTHDACLLAKALAIGPVFYALACGQVSLGLALLSATPSMAQTNSPNLEEVLRQNERMIENLRRFDQPGVDVFPSVQPAQSQSVPDLSQGCFVVHHIRLEGHQPELGPSPESILRQEEGRCFNAQAVNALMSNLNRWYQQNGYTTTRVYAGEQDISQGNLILRVIAGRIESYQFKDTYLQEKRAEQRRLAAAFPAASGAVLNLRDLEQGLENINRLPSQEGKFELLPGQKTGDSVVQIDLTTRPSWRATAMAQNSGSENMGRWNANLEFAFDNLTYRNDQLTLGYNKNLDRGKLGANLQGWTLNYLVPKGYHLYTLSASDYKTTFSLPGINTSYDFHSASGKASLGYEWLWRRDQSSKHSLLAGLELIRQSSYFGEIEIESQRRSLSVLYLGVKGKHYVQNRTFDWSLRAERSVDAFGAMQSIPGGYSARYWTLKAQLAANFPILDGQWLWRPQWRIQKADKDLPSLAQFSIGSRYDVRGFQDNGLYSHTGWYWRNDWERKAIKLDAVSLIPYLGIDFGGVTPNQQQEVTRHSLAGMALGGRFDFGRAVVDLALARSIRRPTQFSNESATRVYAALTASI